MTVITDHLILGTNPRVVNGHVKPFLENFCPYLSHIILCIWCNAIFTRFKVQKTHYFHVTFMYLKVCFMCFMYFSLYIIVAPLCSAFLKRIDFYKAHRSEKRGVL